MRLPIIPALLIVVAAYVAVPQPVLAQDRLFLPDGEIGTNGHFGEVIGPAYSILSRPRVAGHRYAVGESAVVDLLTSATYPRPSGDVVAYDQARPRVFVAREDGVWAIDVLTAQEISVLSHPNEGLASCAHATSADRLLCAYRRGDGQHDIYSSTSGAAAYLTTLRLIEQGVQLVGARWAVTADGTRLYALKCSRPNGTFCFGGRLVVVDVASGVVAEAARDTVYVIQPPRLVLDEVRDRVIVSAESDVTVFTADLDVIATAPIHGVNAWNDVVISPHTDVIYLQTFTQSTYGSVAWLSAFRADSYAADQPRTLLPTTTRGMQLLTAPGAPRHLHADVAGRHVSLAWTNIGAASGFVIEVGRAPGRIDLSMFAGPDARATFSDVPPGTYYVRVRGGNLIGGGRASQEIAVVVE